MLKKMSNNEIYTLALALQEEFNLNSSLVIPVKVNFYLQKNITLLLKLAKEIENLRLNLGMKYGIFNEETMSYQIPDDKRALVQEELMSLGSLEQEVTLYTFKLKDIENLELTIKQMNLLMDMIDED